MALKLSLGLSRCHALIFSLATTISEGGCRCELGDLEDKFAKLALETLNLRLVMVRYLLVGSQEEQILLQVQG